MSIRPIEFQISIPKTFDASKEQQNNLKRSDIHAQQNAISSQEETSKKMHSVKDSDKTENRDLKNDLEGQNSKQDNSRKRNKEKEEKELSEALCFDPGKIDIII